MQYNFFIEKVSKAKYFCIKIANPKYTSLGRFTDDAWNSEKIQAIIDGVKLGKTKPYGEEYNWASEDLEVYVNQKGVLLIDMLAQRAGKQDPKSSTLQLSHEEFLKFLQDFKQFVETNT